MSEKIICDAEDLVAIADAVRASTGGTDTYTVPELSVAAVSAIGNGGDETYMEATTRCPVCYANNSLVYAASGTYHFECSTCGHYAQLYMVDH